VLPTIGVPSAEKTQVLLLLQDAQRTDSATLGRRRYIDFSALGDRR